MKKVLVVDDSATMRLFIKMFLKGIQNITVIEAADGLDGIEKMDHDDFDLVITDLNMPRLDGLKFIEQVRGVMKRKTPIIILTTKGEKEYVDRGILMGADNYLKKPIIGPVLTSMVNSYL